MEAYKLLGVIGEGTYGTVFRAVHVASGAAVAIKRFKDGADRDALVARTAEREVAALRALRAAPGVAALLDAFTAGGRLHLVLELCRGGSALDLLRRHPGGVPPGRARGLVWQAARALAACHAAGYIHRDVKPENLLLAGGGAVRLCDFGFARRAGERADDGGAGGRYTAYVATRWYRAPELLAGARRYGAEVDVWALGCVAAELLTGRPLFPGASDADQLALVAAALGGLPAAPGAPAAPSGAGLPTLRERLAGVDPGAAAFVGACLAADGAARPTAEALLAHPWLAGAAECVPADAAREDAAARERLAAAVRAGAAPHGAAPPPSAAKPAAVAAAGPAISLEARAGLPPLPPLPESRGRPLWTPARAAAAQRPPATAAASRAPTRRGTPGGDAGATAPAPRTAASRAARPDWDSSVAPAPAAAPPPARRPAKAASPYLTRKPAPAAPKPGALGAPKSRAGRPTTRLAAAAAAAAQEAKPPSFLQRVLSVGRGGVSRGGSAGGKGAPPAAATTQAPLAWGLSSQ